MFRRTRALVYRARSWLHRREVAVWYDARYRLPLSSLESSAGLEPRRADYAAWWLRECGAVPKGSFHTPRRATYDELSRVHTAELLERLGQPAQVASIFGVDPSDVPLDEVMTTTRLACGGTVAAARETLRREVPALNLLGGFHHAAPGAAGGFCPVNDVAVALAALRAEGFGGRAVVLDLDAHPPDGIAACLANEPKAWVGSLSGSDWGPLPGVDETVLPEGTGDEAYLEALGALLSRMPRPDLAFVIAGGDVLAGDRFGKLGLSLEGVRERDLLVATELEGLAQVWLPGGGYSDDAWRALGGTGMALATGSLAPIPRDYDPLDRRYARLASELSPEELTDTNEFNADDLAEALGFTPTRQRLLLGFYTAAGIEHALFRFGFFQQLERLGYRHFRVAFDTTGLGERLKVHGEYENQEHVLVEIVLERRRVAGVELLYVHWLSLRNPRAQFSPRRPRLPGQDVPGLGLAREVVFLLQRMAIRLGLGGLAYRPAWLHTAYAARHDLVFADPARQGRFEALLRDLGDVPLLELTQAVADGRVLMNGEPYVWEADEMVYWLREAPTSPEEIQAERERVRFTLVPAGSAPRPAAAKA
ncbi:MAG: histone deacetylase [Anaeromyxobacter sp.]